MAGIYLLVDKVGQVRKTVEGNLPLTNQSLGYGRIVKKGPGFLVPNSQAIVSEMDSLISGSDTVKPLFVPMDVEEGDHVYYQKDAGDPIILDGKDYLIIPYMAIRLFIKD